MALVKKLTRIGNSRGIILSPDILKMTGIEPDGECEIEVKKEGVLLRPHFKRTADDQRVVEAVTRFIKKYRGDLKKLSEEDLVEWFKANK